MTPDVPERPRSRKDGKVYVLNWSRVNESLEVGETRSKTRGSCGSSKNGIPETNTQGRGSFPKEV